MAVVPASRANPVSFTPPNGRGTSAPLVGAFFFAHGDVVEALPLLARRGDGADIRLCVKRVPQPQLLRALHEPFPDLVIDTLMNDEPRGGGAPLPRRPEGPEDDGVH